MFPLGKLAEDDARQFVAANPHARLGSMSSDGRRRVYTEVDGIERRLLELAFPAHGQVEPAADGASVVCTPCQQQAIGDRLAEIIKGHRPNETPCAECRAEIDRLNNMTPEQVLADAKNIASRIVARAAEGAASPIDRLISKALPSIPTAVVSDWIQQAVRESQEPNAGAVG